jgi:acyl-CoA thioester hydrolase
MSELDGSFAENATHRLPLRVYYEDTDAGGVVYHASYLRFMERGRTALLRLLGYRHGELAERHGVTFAVRSMKIDFIAPGHLDDALEVGTRITDVGGASFTAKQTVVCEGRILAEADVRLAAIGPNGRTARMPEFVRAALRAKLG